MSFMANHEERIPEVGRTPNICFVVASHMTAGFLLEHVRRLSRTCAVTIVANSPDPKLLDDAGVKGEVVSVPIHRKISLVADMLALLRLIAFFRKSRFDLVCSVTPKAGLLGMSAAFISRVPARVHIFTGQVWATRRGWARRILRAADRTTSVLATDIVIDSNSQRDFLLREGVVSRSKSMVLGGGSICGVDVNRFRADPEARSMRRAALGFSERDFVFVYVGRLTRDKGVLDLAEAFSRIAVRMRTVGLLMVGPDEDGLEDRIKKICESCSHQVAVLGMTDKPEEFMAAGDMLCLPSYREGFGMVVIEAASCGLPAIGTNIYGVTDAIEDEVTGCLYPPGDIEALARAMEEAASNPEIVRSMGERARRRAHALYSQETVSSAYVQHLLRISERAARSRSARTAWIKAGSHRPFR
jgi:glycosyltransferase involved in cell wall biosynthesis